MFEVNPKSFFGIPAYLTVSGQLQAEIFACAMSRVYTFGPTFRAEMSHTSRHLAEFWMIEPEVVGYDLDDTCSLAEDLIKHVAKSTIDRCPRELEGFKTGDLVDSLASSSPWERVAFDSVSEGQEKLTTEREKELAAKNGPMFVTHYPEHTMPFYMKRSGSNTLNFDLLLPEMGEVVGGSVREEDHDLLANRIADNGIKGLDWYLALRKYGTVPHAGFGLGLERLVSYITGQSNVKDVIPVPRTHSSLQL